MRTISRKFLLCAPFAVAVLLCGCLLGLAGCQSGPSAEELITQDLEEQLGAVRDTDSELYAEFVEDLEASNGEDLDMLGVDATDYVTSLLDGFDYQIEEVTVDEDAGTAAADVTITCKSLYRAMEDFGVAVEQYAEQYVADALASGQTDVDESALYQEMGQLFMDTIDSAVIQDNACTFNYTRDDEGVWEVDESAEDELLNAMLGTPSSEQ